MKKLSFLIAIALLFSVKGFSQEYLKQTLKTFKNPDELVSMSPSISFNQAIAVLNKVSEKMTGRSIVSTVSSDSAIGVQVQNMNYMQALTMLVKMGGLVYEEKPDVIIVKAKNTPQAELRTKDNYVSVDAREVRISAIFFEEDVSKSKQRGINWQTAFQKEGLNVGGNILTFAPSSSTNSSSGSGSTGTGSTGTGTGSTSTNVQTNGFNLSASATNLSLGGFFGKATAIFQFFESQNLGDIISSPSITVLDGTDAKLQDGQDISIKTKDFSGNIIDNFYSIGSIVKVTPHIIEQDGVRYILLNIHVERSSFVPDQTTTIINKTAADTKVVMLNGEETVIGGMFINQTTTVRSGIPFLKDLPWWVLGLRYIFGSDQNQEIKKELVILIKASLIPTLKDRLAGEQSRNPLGDELKSKREEFNKYQQNQSSNDGK